MRSIFVRVEPTVRLVADAERVESLITWFLLREPATPFAFERQSPLLEGLVLPIADSALVGSG